MTEKLRDGNGKDQGAGLRWQEKLLTAENAKNPVAGGRCREKLLTAEDAKNPVAGVGWRVSAIE